MPAFQFREFSLENDEKTGSHVGNTGNKIDFIADDEDKAADSALTFLRLGDDAAMIGPTGRVVYSGNKALVLSRESVDVAKPKEGTRRLSGSGLSDEL